MCEALSIYLMKSKIIDGTFDIEGTIITPNTTERDIQNSSLNMKCKSFPKENQTVFYGNDIVMIDQSPFFVVEIRFFNKTISSVLLFPYMQYPDRMKSLYERQQLRYVACCRWLSLRLGAPTYKNQEEFSYKFSWGTIAAVTHLLPRDRCNAGYIVIRFKKSAV